MTRSVRWMGPGLAMVVCLSGCAGGADADGQGSLEDGVPEARGPSEKSSSAIPEAVGQELLRLGEEDQAPRMELSPETMQDTLFARRMLRGDSLRTARLREIVGTYGWPDSARVGAEAAQAAFLILQHSPLHDFQKEMLPSLEELARAGRMPSDEVAMLVDRVLTHDGLPQRYGTQFTLVDGQWVLDPVEDEAALDSLRASVGLPGLEEYMRVMEEFTRAPVVRRR